MKVNYKRYTICNVLRWQIDHVGSFQKQFGCPTERKRMRWKRAVLFFAQVSATLESILRHIQSPLHPGICPRPNWFHGSGPNWFYSRWIYTYIKITIYSKLRHTNRFVIPFKSNSFPFLPHPINLLYAAEEKKIAHNYDLSLFTAATGRVNRSQRYFIFDIGIKSVSMFVIPRYHRGTVHVHTIKCFA